MAQQRPQHMAGWFRYDPAIRTWLWTFLDTWLAHDKRAAREQQAA
jgi:GMP synthase (glutamine-hydrolysing)